MNTRTSMRCPARIDVTADVAVRCRRIVGMTKGGRQPSPHAWHVALVRLGGVDAVLRWNATVSADAVREAQDAP